MQLAVRVDSLALIGTDRLAGPVRAGHLGQRRGAQRIMEGVSAQRRRLRCTDGWPVVELLHAQPPQALLEVDVAGQDAPHRPATAVVRHPFEERQHAATFGPDRAVGLDMGAQGGRQTTAGRQRLGVQLGIPSRQPDGITGRQRLIGQRREEAQCGAQRRKRVEVGRIDEGKGTVARHGDGPARQRPGGIGVQV